MKLRVLVLLSLVLAFLGLRAPGAHAKPKKPRPGYNGTVASVFRQWVSVCNFSPDLYPAGAYLLQIRTNIARNATQAQMAGAG